MLKKFSLLWIPVAFWALVIFFFSSLPFARTTEISLWDFIAKKSAHLTEYFIFFILLYRAIKNSTSLSQKRIFLLSLLILIAYAISDEIHQSFSPGREPRIRDIIIDGGGGLIALWFIKYKLARVRGRLLNWAKNWQIL